MKQIIISPNSNRIQIQRGPFVKMKVFQKLLSKRKNIKIVNQLINRKNIILWQWLHFPTDKMIEHYEKTNAKLILGTNTFFRKKPMTEGEKRIINSKNVILFFANSEKHANAIRQYNKTAKIKVIPTPVELSLLKPYDKPRKYDILIFKKHCDDKILPFLLENLKGYEITVLEYGSYQRVEIFTKSSQSKCCLYLSRGESGGLAIAEMLCEGCPIISYQGNLNYGINGENCFMLENQNDMYDINKINNLIEKTIVLDNKQIAINAQHKFNPVNIVNEILEELEKL